jgi:hypothetical protein
VPSKQRIRLYPQLNAVAVTESGFDERPYRCPARAGAALRDWMASTMAQAETSGSDLDGRFWERRAQHADIMNAAAPDQAVI